MVISRWQGEKAEKRVSSVPFTLFVPNGERSSVRMGGQIPVPQMTVQQKEGGSAPISSYQYQSVGTNIDVGSSTNPVENGRYRFKITVSDNQIAAGPAAVGADTAPLCFA